MRSSCCQAGLTVQGDTTKYYECDKCKCPCDIAMKRPHIVQDDMMETFREMNDRYAKLLVFVRYVASDAATFEHDIGYMARTILQEIDG